MPHLVQEIIGLVHPQAAGMAPVEPHVLARGAKGIATKITIRAYPPVSHIDVDAVQAFEASIRSTLNVVSIPQFGLDDAGVFAAFGSRRIAAGIANIKMNAMWVESGV
jgi:hypothetical protein